MIDHIKKARLEILEALQTVNFKDPLYEVLEGLSMEMEELIIEFSKKT